MQMSDVQVRRFAALFVGRRDDYALQQADGRYTRAGQPLTYEALRLHLAGGHTIGTYVIDERGRCRFAVLDADDQGGLLQLLEVQHCLAGEGIVSYTELSRRGLHLWVLLARLVSPRLLRRWLLPFCPAGVEFNPKQDDLSADRRYGSLVRLPLGMHRVSGRRYPFVSLVDGRLVPVACSVSESLAWLSSVQRSLVPELPISPEPDQATSHENTKMLNKKEAAGPDALVTSANIDTWCLSQDPFRVIGRYVKLDQRGMGCCPFGEHHSDGRDSRPSFQVRPLRPGSVNCWYCYAWQRGGSVFGFLCLWHHVTARQLWHRILVGESF